MEDQHFQTIESYLNRIGMSGLRKLAREMKAFLKDEYFAHVELDGPSLMSLLTLFHLTQEFLEFAAKRFNEELRRMILGIYLLTVIVWTQVESSRFTCSKIGRMFGGVGSDFERSYINFNLKYSSQIVRAFTDQEVLLKIWLSSLHPSPS